jgi:serine protease Do
VIRRITIYILIAIAIITILGNFTGQISYQGRPLKQKIEIIEGTTVAQSPETTRMNGSFADVVKKVSPSLVNISAVHIVEVQEPYHHFYFGDPFEDFFDEFFGVPDRRRFGEPAPQKRRYEGTGSGFIIDTDGYVLTNYHVIKDAQEIKVTTYDDKQYDAKLVGKDSKTDLAVVKIKSSKRFNALKLGDSKLVEVGDWVVAGGSPFGLNQTFTVGIISAVRQKVKIENVAYEDMIQTDAAINRGNSGGPLVDLHGQVIGINTAIYAPTGVFSGVGFAIPINQAKIVMTDLIEKGRVVRGWLGVEIMGVNEAISRQFNLEKAQGVLINKVVEDSPAEKGGLKRGDVIIGVDGREIKNVKDLQNRVARKKPGDSISLKIINDGTEKDIKIKLGEMPDEAAFFVKKDYKDEIGVASWKGIRVSNINAALKDRYGINQNEGIAIIEIDPADEGYEFGLRIGDIIVQINKIEIFNLDNFKVAVKKIELKNGVLFDIIRDGSPMYVSYQKGG